MISSLVYVTVAIVLLLVIKLYNKLTVGWCRTNVCLTGRTVLITGASSGLGFETAENLAMRGARVILACRNETKGKDAEHRIKKVTDNNNVLYKHLDLATLESVHQFADWLNKNETRLDILVNNAGVLNMGSQRTDDGLLSLMAANYFGHFLLTNLLLDLLLKTPNSRIVNVTSTMAKKAKVLNLIDELNATTKGFLSHYQRSKVCLSLFTIELSRRLKDTGVTAYAVHPGEVSTNIYETLPPVLRVAAKHIFGKFVKNTLEGAQTIIHCSVAKEIEPWSGGHFRDCRFVSWFSDLKDPQLPGKLWNATLIHVKLKKL